MVLENNPDQTGQTRWFQYFPHFFHWTSKVVYNKERKRDCMVLTCSSYGDAGKRPIARWNSYWFESTKLILSVHDSSRDSDQTRHAHTSLAERVWLVTLRLLRPRSWSQWGLNLQYKKCIFWIAELLVTKPSRLAGDYQLPVTLEEFGLPYRGHSDKDEWYH